MILKNEKQLLKEFLAHHKELYDELIIVDTGSTDNTIEIAKKFTDKIYRFKWVNDFSKARNFSIKKATKDWILWLDPDERIDKKDFKKLLELTKDKSNLGYSFIQKTYTNATAHPRFKAEEKHNFKGYYIRRICKLFQNKQIEFIYPIHETVKNSVEKAGKIKKTDIIIEHFPEVKDKKFLVDKHYYYIQLLTRKQMQFKDSNAKKETKTESMCNRETI